MIFYLNTIHFRAATCNAYSPGLGVLLEEAESSTIDWPQTFYQLSGRGGY